MENSNQYTPVPFRVIGGLHLKSSQPDMTSKASPKKQLSMAQHIMKNVEHTATQKYSQDETNKKQKLQVIQKEVDTSVFAEVAEEEKEAAKVAAALKAAAATAAALKAAAAAAANNNTILPPVEVAIMDDTFEDEQIFSQMTTASSSSTATATTNGISVITAENAIVQKRAVKNNLMDYLLYILNEGTYEQLTALKGIGKIRAMKIFTERNAGHPFEHIDDLENIDMNEKAIQRFIQQNLGMMMFP